MDCCSLIKKIFDGRIRYGLAITNLVLLRFKHNNISISSGMKNLLIAFSFFIFCFFISCYSTQQKKYFVIDQSGVLDSSQREELNDLYLKHEKITTNQIVLLTTNSFYPDSTIEQYA